MSASFQNMIFIYRILYMYQIFFLNQLSIHYCNKLHDKKNSESTNEKLEIPEVTLSNTFSSPGTMMVVTPNTNITFIAMYCTNKFWHVASFTIIYSYARLYNLINIFIRTKLYWYQDSSMLWWQTSLQEISQRWLTIPIIMINALKLPIQSNVCR